MEQFHTPDKPRIVKSEETPEVSGEIGKTTAEQSAELRSEIGKQEKLRDALRRAGQMKLVELESMERAHTEELMELTKMQVDGRLSEETLKAEESSRLEKEEETKRDMKRNFDDADELEREIEQLKSRLDGLEN